MLFTRVLSAAVLAPVAVAAVWLGSPYFDILVAVAGAIMAWEWARICRGRFGGSGALMAVVAGGVGLAAATHPVTGAAAVWVGCLLIAAVSRSGWLAFGTLYVGLPVVALVWLREVGGMMTMLWLFCIVWATDTGAYAAGRGIGGPLLAPRISPKKTWAGLIGGMISAAVVGAGFGLAAGVSSWAGLAAFSALLAVVAQIGDLFESSVKRRFNVKDSSAIIPGHGGVLDRVDGLIAAAPVVALAVLAFRGGLETW
ncbi:phosphatidate cytidylyltransferase [Novispirillum sp. DQ9]|uniref:phosphatidate cytidylyltransferase n=1 Tax=Novispirillum sp. DQ9 TaxID=3398612 RepID=UPI003C7BC601